HAGFPTSIRPEGAVVLPQKERSRESRNRDGRTADGPVFGKSPEVPGYAWCRAKPFEVAGETGRMDYHRAVRRLLGELRGGDGLIRGGGATARRMRLRARGNGCSPGTWQSTGV